MTKEKEDFRIQRTKKAILHAIHKLLLTNMPDEITVTRLAQEAEISRKTFYLHYNDMESLIEDVKNNYIKNLYELVKDTLSDNVEDVYKHIMLSLTADPEWNHVMLTKFYTKYIQTIFDYRLDASDDSDNIQYLFLYIMYTIPFIFNMWYNTGMTISPEVMAGAACRLVFDGVNSFHCNWDEFSHFLGSCSAEQN